MLIGKVRQLFDRANDQVIVISAFIGKQALDDILSVVSSSASKTIYVRWRVQDILSRATDPGIYEIAEKYGANLLCHSRLHAKAYIADGKALIGSANATSPGFEIATASNLELLLETDVNVPEITELLGVLDAEAKQATRIPDELLAKIDNIENEIDFDSKNERSWIPKSYFQDTVSFLHLGTWNSFAAKDCMALKLSIGSDEDEIKQVFRRSNIYSILRKHLDKSAAGMPVNGLSQLLTENFGLEYKNISRCEPLLDWIHNCTNDMYVYDYGTSNPVLTPWNRK